MRELSSLIGLQVIATNEGKKLGSVADAYVDLAAGELVCVTLAKTPELRVILAEDLDVIGADAIMVSDREKLRSREDVEEQLERGKRVLSSPPMVITSQGKTLGQLGAVQIDEATGKVIRFEVTGGAFKDLTEGVLALPVLEGIIHGEDTVIVPHDVVARRLEQAGGLRGTLRSLGEKLRVGIEDIGERSGEFVREGEEKIKKGAEEARKKASEATRKAAEATEKARQRISEVAEDAKEAVTSEEAEEGVGPPEAEPDAPRAEDPLEEREGAEETAQEPCEEHEVHLVPEAATPLPAGDEAEETGDEETIGDAPSDDQGDKESS